MSDNKHHSTWMERALSEGADHVGTEARAFDPEQLTVVCRGDRELERFVLGKFLTEAPGYLRSMRKAAESGDFDELLTRSHAFRDASQVVGAYELARAWGRPRAGRFVDADALGRVDRGVESAGWAGLLEASATINRLQPSIMVGYGYTAIVVAWLARLNPLTIGIASFLLAALRVGARAPKLGAKSGWYCPRHRAGAQSAARTADRGAKR